MSRPEAHLITGRAGAARTTTPAADPPGLAALPAERDHLVFQEPWQASAFALAVHLSERGALAWTEWSAALAQEIRAAEDPAELDGYFRQWLRALERICVEKGMLDPAEIRRRQEEWRRAYLETPHGEPVELRAAHRSDPRTRG
jgi:nitrile hydratase accessory protein